MAYRKCKECGKKSTVEAGLITGLYFFCCNECRVTWGINNAKQLATKAKVTREKTKRKEIKEAKESLKTAGDYIKEAQVAFNKFVRIRDHGKPCISCGSTPQQKFGGNIDSGHYRSRGAASHLRFNLYNCHAQCVKCNRNLSGNVVEYRIRLIRKIGLERVEQLEQDNRPKRFSIPYLIRVKKIFNKRARLYEKLFR